ncbi:outer membrane protein assembly factor BamA [Candidatus Pelagibacter sp.]|nr:outer membrane protein assembly factor BamA [Candidatus Pelagibacter sp.]
MIKLFLKVNFVLFFFTSLCFSEIINSTNISGNKRISKESILMFGNIDLNKNYESADLNLILKNLYETKFFKDIKINLSNNILNINIIENPIIESLEINGLKKKSFQDLILDKLYLKSRNSYSESAFSKDLNLVKIILKTNGYYFSKIETSTVINEDQNSIKLIYNIDLGKKAKIKEIKFVGDKKFKDRKLNQIILSEESKFWKVISKSIYLDYNRIELDKRLLLNFYKNNGYYNVKIEDSFVELSNDGDFNLTFSINSGQKFIFNELSLEMPADFDERYFVKINDLLKSLNKETYSLNKVDNILKEVEKIALSKDYQFLDASLSEKIVNNNELNIKIFLSETEKFYVEKINILGNQHTIEEVIRNSLIVDEGDAYNEILFNNSINNLKAKNIFKTVEFNIKDGSDANLKVIDLNIEEKPTGEISLGAGFGTQGGTFGGGIIENNFLGKGVKLDTNFSLSKGSVNGKFIYAKPNFNYTDNTLFTSIESISSDKIKDFGYKTSELGFSVGTRFEQYENLYFRPDIAITYEKLKTSSTASASYKKQAGDFFDTYLIYSLDYDKRDQKYRTTEGFRTVFYQEIPIVSDGYELVNSIETTRFYQLPSEMVAKFSFFGKAVNAISSNKDTRLSKRLFIPSQKLRGFEAGKVGPIENNDYIGGNYISTINFTTTLPQILTSFQNADISFFIDAANIWGVDYNSSLNKNKSIRSSIGIGLDLQTPVGPLSFSLSETLSKSSTDITESFRFNLGTTF